MFPSLFLNMADDWTPFRLVLPSVIIVSFTLLSHRFFVVKFEVKCKRQVDINQMILFM